MPEPGADNGAAITNFPPLRRHSNGQVDVDSVPDVIEWFLQYDQRVAIVKHPAVQEVFQWKQQLSKSEGLGNSFTILE